MTNLEMIARAYVNSVELEERARAEASALAEDISVLRADLHSLFMDGLRSAKIPFFDRFDAAHIAHEIVNGHRKIA